MRAISVFDATRQRFRKADLIKIRIKRGEGRKRERGEKKGDFLLKSIQL